MGRNKRRWNGPCARCRRYRGSRAHRVRPGQGLAVKGKWAAGIQPRNLTWIIKDRLAISERPGGYGRSHRKVRRQEEMIWLRENGFSRVVSILGSPHNMAAYEEFGFPASHLPFGPHDDPREALPPIYEHLRTWLAGGERLLVHGEEVG